MTNQAWAHRILLERYKAGGMKSNSTGRWSELRDDGYIHAHLCWHMEKAGEFDQIVELLQEETNDGGNAWYEVRDGLAQAGGYVTDLLRAWELTRERSRGDVNWGEKITTLGLEIRFLLMVTSVNSLSASIPIDLMGHLVRYGVWKPEVAVAYCRRIPRRDMQGRALCAIAVALAEMQRAKLALDVLHDLVRISMYWDIVEAVEQVAPHLTETELADVLSLTLEIGATYYRVNILRVLLPYLSQEQVQEQVQAALVLAQQQADLYERTHLLVITASCLGEREREKVLSEALLCARQIEDTEQRVRALSRIADSLPKYEERALILTEIFTLSEKIEKASTRANLLISLAPSLTEKQLSMALSLLWDSKKRAYNSDLLQVLVPLLTRQQLDSALSQAQQTENRDRHIDALMMIIPHLARTGQADRALSMAFERVPASQRSTLLCAIMPFLDAEQLQKLCVRVSETLDLESSEYARTHLLASLAERGCATQALSMARSFQDSVQRANLLAQILPHLTAQEERDRVLAEIFAATEAIEEPDLRVDPLITMLPHLKTADERNRVLAAALSATHEIEEGAIQWYPMKQIVNHLKQQGEIQQALSLAREIQCSSDRAHVLTGIVPFLTTEGERLLVLTEALALAREIDDVHEHTENLKTLAAHLTEEELGIALSIAREVEEVGHRTTVLEGIAPALAALGKTEEALRLLDEIWEWRGTAYGSSALGEIPPHLTAPQRNRLLSLARTIEDPSARIKALTALAASMPVATERSLIIAEALAIVFNGKKDERKDESEDKREENKTEEGNTYTLPGRETLREMAAQLTEEQLQRLLDVAHSANEAWHRTDILIAAAPYLTAAQLEQAFVIVHELITITGNERYPALHALINALVQRSDLSQVLTGAWERMRMRSDRDLFLLDIVPRLAAKGKKEEAAFWANAIVNSNVRAKALKSLQPDLIATPTVARKPPIPFDLTLEIEKLSDKPNRFDGVAAHLTDLPDGEFYPLWEASLQRVALWERRTVLEDKLSALVPILRKHGDDETMKTVLLALRDVARWWP